MTQFTLVNHDTERTFIEDSRSDAEDRKQNGIDEFGFAESDLDVRKGAFEEYADVEINPEPEPDGGNAEVVDSPEPAEPAAPTEQLPDDGPSVSEDPLAQLGEELGTDPLSILPGHMIDQIQGEPAVNKRGYAMIAERYGIEVQADVVELPWENDEGRCVARATATTEDGKEYSGWATACADDGDMPEQLIELAETRSLKRAVSWGSGVGIVSYQELSEELEDNR